MWDAIHRIDQAFEVWPALSCLLYAPCDQAPGLRLSVSEWKDNWLWKFSCSATAQLIAAWCRVTSRHLMTLITNAVSSLEQQKIQEKMWFRTWWTRILQDLTKFEEEFLLRELFFLHCFIPVRNILSIKQ